MERLIRKRLTLNRELSKILQGFDGEPAIYYSKAPYDTDKEFKYPQVVLSVERFNDAIHGVAGLLTVEIICTQATLTPEPIERLIRETLEGVFFRGAEIFLLKWVKSEPYTEPASERLPLIIGLEMEFEVREYPKAETSTPDAIQALNDWAGKIFVVSRTPFEDFFIPSREYPAIYFETLSERLLGSQAAVSWTEATVKGHVFAPKVRMRREWLTILSRDLMTLKAIPLRDGSPLRVTGVEVDYSADELAGQLQIKCEYGIPRAKVKTIPINHCEILKGDKRRHFDDYMRRQKDVHDRGIGKGCATNFQAKPGVGIGGVERDGQGKIQIERSKKNRGKICQPRGLKIGNGDD